MPQDQITVEQKKTEERIKKLEAQIAVLTEFMDDKKKTQLTYPLDLTTQQIIQAGVPRLLGAKVTNTAPFLNDWYLPVVINNVEYHLLGTNETA